MDGHSPLRLDVHTRAVGCAVPVPDADAFWPMRAVMDELTQTATARRRCNTIVRRRAAKNFLEHRSVCARTRSQCTVNDTSVTTFCIVYFILQTFHCFTLSHRRAGAPGWRQCAGRAVLPDEAHGAGGYHGVGSAQAYGSFPHLVRTVVGGWCRWCCGWCRGASCLPHYGRKHGGNQTSRGDASCLVPEGAEISNLVGLCPRQVGVAQHQRRHADAAVALPFLRPAPEQSAARAAAASRAFVQQLQYP